MKKFLALLLVLAPLCLSAQTTHTFPALDSENIFTGNNSFFRLIPPHGTVAQEPLLPLLWTVYVVTDGASGSDCTVGAGTSQHWCGWTGTAWIPLGGSGGGGGGTPCGVVNDVQVADGAGGFACDSGIFQEFQDTHTLDVWIGNFAQQIQISDPAHTGVACFGHSNGAVVDSSFCQSLSPTFSTTNSGYKIYLPDSPGLGSLTITSLTPDGNGFLSASWALPRPTRVCYMNIDGGTGSAGVVASGDTLVSQCYNDFGATLTVTAVRCFSDNSGGTTVNPKVTGGSNLLSGALTCTSSWGSGTLSGTPTLAAGHTFDEVATPDGTTKLLHVEITLQ